jgi:hypothetical protein
LLASKGDGAAGEPMIGAPTARRIRRRGIDSARRDRARRLKQRALGRALCLTPPETP